jgi:uncharacterized protein YpmB
VQFRRDGARIVDIVHIHIIVVVIIIIIVIIIIVIIIIASLHKQSSTQNHTNHNINNDLIETSQMFGASARTSSFHCRIALRRRFVITNRHRCRRR